MAINPSLIAAAHFGTTKTTTSLSSSRPNQKLPHPKTTNQVRTKRRASVFSRNTPGPNDLLQSKPYQLCPIRIISVTSLNYNNNFLTISAMAMQQQQQLSNEAQLQPINNNKPFIKPTFGGIPAKPNRRLAEYQQNRFLAEYQQNRRLAEYQQN